MKNSMIRILTLAAAMAFAPGVALGQLTIDWFTIDGGGGESRGGDFSVSGGIGQSDAGEPQTGGDFSLTGGFWAGVEVIQSPEAPQLGVSRDTATGDVTIFWSLPDNGFQLFRSATLGQAPNPWQLVQPFLYQTDGVIRFITIPNPTGQNYFKLFAVPAAE